MLKFGRNNWIADDLICCSSIDQTEIEHIINGVRILFNEWTLESS